MKWLKLDCDFPDDPKIKCLAREWGGETAAAFWTLLLALIGKYGGTECSVRIDNAGQFSEAFIASRLSSKPQVTLRRLSRAAHLGLIDAERWEKHREIFLPNMLKRIDDYTRKIRTKSGQSPDKALKSRTVELEKEVDKEKKNPPTPFKTSISKTEITSPGNLKIKHIHSEKCKDFGFCPEAIL